MGKTLPVIGMALFLSGCALPVPLQIASWALDGISFLATEKSLTDHGISIVAQKDCALWRGLKGDDVCSSYDDAETFAVAAVEQQAAPAEAMPDEDIAAIADFETAAGKSDVEPVVASKPETRRNEGDRLMISGKRIWSERLDADLYYVIGSFSNRGNARRMINKHGNLGPAVMASRMDGVEVYRVAVGPFSSNQKRAMFLELKRAGIGNAWAMRVDHSAWRLANQQELADPTETIAVVPSQPKPAVELDEVAETPTVDPELAPSSELIDGDMHYLVIGSFSNVRNAEMLADSKASLSPRVVISRISGEQRHRVVLGPYAKDEIAQARRLASDKGIDRIWALQLDSDHILDDTLLAEEAQEEGPADEIAETPNPLDDNSGWGGNLVQNIIDMFRSPDTASLAGVVPPLES